MIDRHVVTSALSEPCRDALASSGVGLPRGGPDRMLNGEQRRFLTARRVAHLATADAQASPHVVPVCFVLKGDNIYITIDDKPKRRPGADLKRLRNISENPSVALIADHYDDADWSRLGWVMVRGRGTVLVAGAEHAEAQRLLRARYPQMRAMALERQPVIAVRIGRVTSWGNLEAGSVG